MHNYHTVLIKMIEHNIVGWFEIPVEDMDRAENFYQTVLGVKLDRQEEKEGMLMSWFPMYQDKIGSTGSLVKHDQAKPGSPGTVVYFSCEDIDTALKRVEANGGEVVVPKKDIGEYGSIAWFKDTEGNIQGLHTTKK